MQHLLLFERNKSNLKTIFTNHVLANNIFISVKNTPMQWTLVPRNNLNHFGIIVVFGKHFYNIIFYDLLYLLYDAYDIYFKIFNNLSSFLFIYRKYFKGVIYLFWK